MLALWGFFVAVFFEGNNENLSKDVNLKLETITFMAVTRRGRVSVEWSL